MPAYRYSKVTQRPDAKLARMLWRASDLTDGDIAPVASGDPTITNFGREGRRLLADDFVSTRSCAAPFPTPHGGRFVSDFGPFRSFTFELS